MEEETCWPPEHIVSRRDTTRKNKLEEGEETEDGTRLKLGHRGLAGGKDTSRLYQGEKEHMPTAADPCHT